MSATMTSPPNTVVVVDDQQEVRRLLAEIFGERGRVVIGFGDGDDAIRYVADHAGLVELVVADLDLGPGRTDGIEICSRIHTAHPDVPIIILTGTASVDKAVLATKAGAADFLVKDSYLEDNLELSVEKIERMLVHMRERRRLEVENRALRAANAELRQSTGTRWHIVGSSPSLTSVMDKVERVAAVPRPVLVLGERGTGKELIARAIHHLSPRSTEPYITINCAAVPESLLESELFGHEQGAFTGATKQKEGKFELADGGTLFLDEIGNMSLDFQAKILRVVEYQRFERVAGAESIQVDVRVIAATNADLKQEMREGRFRRDLYDRLAFEVILVPPLRDRLEDIPELAAHFVGRFHNEVAGLCVREITAEALECLAGYDYPGNVRELKNVVERAAYSAEGNIIDTDDVLRALPPAEVVEPSVVTETIDDPTLPLDQRVENFEKALCRDALERSRYNQREAAERLGLTYDQFRQRYRKYRMSAKAKRE